MEKRNKVYRSNRRFSWTAGRGYEKSIQEKIYSFMEYTIEKKMQQILIM